ncbi:MAG TPA: carbohydrate-binding module family 20 domain-containing protein [Micromonosporaceae bacterium]|nr:carbohydrate-binding module family 20 domain-containing protein [Micromonosporaceae bacterium]
MRLRTSMLTTLALVAALLAGGLSRQAAPHAAASPASPGPKDVIVHLFQWPWDSVARECRDVLGPKGFGGVQVSPPQEHVVLPSRAHPWWQDYQPVSYQIVSRRGNRDAFASMVRACHDAGVKIYVDAVVNHMAGGGSVGRPGIGGSTFSQYAYPAVPNGHGDFHHCGRNGNDDIVNWGDRWEVQNCELVDLSDLATEKQWVRDRLVGYLNDLVSLGVDGFRVDAAKHLPAGDLAAVMGPVTSGRYIYSETMEGGPGEPGPEEYVGIGDVTEFRYGDVVSDAFRTGDLGGLIDLPGRMRVNGLDAVVFIDNHDTQRNGRNVLTYKNGTPYALAEAFMLVFPWGVPQVMSSYTFSNHDQGPPASFDGTTSAVSCGAGWECEHRWRTTANMVAVRNSINNAGGPGMNNWWSGGSAIAFGRGNAAYVAFNRSGTAVNRTFQTSLPAGTYCDVMSGDFADGSCAGAAYTVDSGGRVTATVPANGALALHVNARVTNGGGCATAQVSLAEEATTVWGENVFVVGDHPALGNWNPANAVPLSSATYPVWRATLTLPGGTTVRYKYIKKNGSQVIWESDPNRSRGTPSATPCSATWNDTWR